MNPTERFAIPRNRYVERPPDLEYRPTATTLAQAVMRELDAAPWAEGAARGALSLAVDGEKSVETLEEEKIAAWRKFGSRAPFGQRDKTLYDDAVRRCTQIEAERVTVNGAGWHAACDDIRTALATRMGLAGCDIEIDVHKLLMYSPGDHFDTHADTEKSEGMVASAVVVADSTYTGGTLVMTHRGAEARLLDGAAPRGHIQWAVWYADLAHRIEPIRSGHRVAITLNIRLGSNRALEARPMRDTALKRSFHTRSYEDHHTRWAQRAGFAGTDTRQYARKLVWLLAHRYTEPGLTGALLKGADRQLAALLDDRWSAERVLLGWIEARTVGYVRPHRDWDWSDNDPWWYARRTMDHKQYEAEKEEDRAGLDFDPSDDDERYDDESAMSRVDMPPGLPVLEMGRTRRRDLWVEGLRTLDGEDAGYGRIAVETCELSPPEAVETLRTSGARVYEATGNEGAILELQYRRAALVSWQPNASALEMLAQCGGRRALAAECVTAHALEARDGLRRHGSAPHMHEVAPLWGAAMAADGGGPAPEAHRALLSHMRKDEEGTYVREIASLDLDVASAPIVARALREEAQTGRNATTELVFRRLIEPRPSWCLSSNNRSGAEALLEHLMTDAAGLAIAERACGQIGREAVKKHAKGLKRESHRNEYARRRRARFTRDYPGDGLPDPPARP